MLYEGKCGSCLNFESATSNEAYDATNANYVKGFCNWYKSYYYPDDSCSTHYHSRGGSSSDCYITTILCNRIGLDDNCEELETLRGFRKDVLQKEEQYKDILFEYDTVGPLIAKELEKTDMIIVKGLKIVYIDPVISFIKEGQTEEAIERYREMTELLTSFYRIERKLDIPEDYDLSSGGHGRLVKKMK